MYLRCFFVATLLTAHAFAGPKVELLESIFFGSGCEEGAQARISPNAKRIDFHFGDFGVIADEDAEKNLVTRDCKAIVRLGVPHGYSVAILRVKYKGGYELPFGAYAHLLGVHLVNDNELVHFTKRYCGLANGTFTAEKIIAYESLDWTPCGEEAAFSAVTTIALSTKKSLPEGSFQVRGSSEKSGLTYYLAWRRCKQRI